MLRKPVRIALFAITSCLLLGSLWGCPPEEDDNSPPVAEDDEATVMAGQSIDIEVLDNDEDPDDDDLEIVSVTEPDGGSVDIDRDEIEYEADADFVGEDSFEYTIDDGNGHQATATVTVTVSAQPTLVITSPDEGDAIDGRTVAVTFEVTGCEVARPGDNSDGCHLHRYLDDENYSNPDDPDTNATGWYESGGFDLIMGTAGEHSFVLRLTKNDGSDDAWEPEILDTVSFTSTAEGDDDDSASP